MQIVDLGLFTIELPSFQNLAQMPLYDLFLYFFIDWYLWVAFVLLGLWGLGKMWMFWRNSVFDSKQTYVLLAIDIPKLNEQTPKAVENIYAALAGAHNDPNLKEKYIDGYFQVGYSMEIVSIDGYVQFLIRTPIKFRELVEAAIYAQYPDAEIAEVNDYAKAIDVKFPNDEYGLWGSDITLVRDYVYPIRTYPEFEHSMSQELKDPMAVLLEIMSKIKKGQQMWFQILIVPVLNVSWQEACIKQINKILGIATSSKKTKTQKVFDAPLEFITLAKEQIVGGGRAEGEEKKADANMLAYLPPNQKAEVDGIGRKMAKICYRTKIRFVYFGKKEGFNKGLSVSGFFGVMKQFNTEDLNAMKPHGKTKTVPPYFFKKMRMAHKQNRILGLYQNRSMDSFGDPFYLNIEELASLWHFPVQEVKAPLVQKIESKKGSAPIGLPTESTEERPVLGAPLEKEEKAEFEPVIDFATDDFEKRFAKDKTGQTTTARRKYIKEKYNLEEIEERKELEAREGKKGIGEEEKEELEKAAEEEIPAGAGSVLKEKPKALRPIENDKDEVPDNLPFV